MAELAASIVGLATTAEVVFNRIYKYIKQVKRAEQEIRELFAEVNGLYGTLRSISLIIDDIEGAGSDKITDLKYVAICGSALDRLRDKLAPFHENNARNTVRKKLKWPFSRSETLEIKNQIEPCKSQLSLALSADGISATLKVIREVKTVANKLEEFKELLKAQARITLNEENEKLLTTVGPRNPLRHHQTNVALRHPGTGTWFIDGPDFQSWLHSQNSKIWVYGIPGAGKSILAAAAIAESLRLSSEHNAVAYFYCDYKDVETQDPRHILGSLAEQIARQSERSFERLAGFVKTHSQNDRVQTFHCSCDSLCELIVDMSSDFRNLTVAVDGLDECGDNARTVVKHLVSLSASSPKMKSFLSSRDHIDIRDFLKDYNMILIAAQSIDLRLYVGAEIEERTQKTSRKRLYMTDPNLKGEIMDKLIDGAEGMFRWVAVQLDYICDLCSDADIRSALCSLPPDLNSSYERLLHQVNRRPPASQRIVQYALKWIMWERFVSPEALGEALSVKLGMERLDRAAVVSEERILQLCGSLIRKSVDGRYLESAHFSVKEFLLSLGASPSPTLVAYGLSEAADQKYFAITALTYFCYKDFANPGSTQDDLHLANPRSERYLYSKYPFREFSLYNVTYWAQNHQDIPEIFELLKRMFSPTCQSARIFMLKERLLLSLRSYPGAKSVFEEPVFEESVADACEQMRFISPLHHAAMDRLPRLCDWLLETQNYNGCNTRSPLGMPIHCALRGKDGLLLLVNTATISHSDIGVQALESLVEIKSFKATVRVLVSWGTDLSRPLPLKFENGSKEYSIVYPLFRALDNYDLESNLDLVESCLELAQILVHAGALLCEGCLDLLDRWRRVAADNKPNRFIRTITPSQVRPGLESRFAKMSLLATETFSEGADLVLPSVVRLRANSEATEELFEKAMAYEDYSILRHLLDNKILSVRWRDVDGQNAFHLAAKNDSLELTRFLLDYWDFSDSRSLDGRTPLHHAMAFASPDLIRLLLSRGTDLYAFDNDGCSVWHMAATQNNHEALKLLQNEPGNAQALLNETNYYGETALLLACKQTGTPGVFHYLRTPIGEAAVWVRATTARYLVDAGVDLAIKDNDGWAAVHYAATKGDVDVVRVLAKDRTCWRDKCDFYFGDDRVSEMLLTHLAAVGGHKECLEFLLSFTGLFSIEDKAGSQCSLLLFATYAGNFDVVEYLLQKGARCAANADGITPLHLAVELKRPEIVHALLRYGHDVHVTDYKGRTPMMIARHNRLPTIVSALRGRTFQENSKSLRLVSSGLDANIEASAAPRSDRPSRKRTAMQRFKAKQRDLGFAIRAGDMKYCRHLISQGASLVSLSSYCGKCGPLIESLMYNQPDIAQLLIEKEANLASVTCAQHSCRGYTALHYCALRNFSSILHELLNRRPGLLFISSDIHPIYIAIANHSYQCIQIMLDRSADAWRRFVGSYCFSNIVSETTEEDNQFFHATTTLHDRSQKFNFLTSSDLTQVPMKPTLSFSWQLSDQLFINNRRSSDPSPLHSAVRVADVEAATILLDHGAFVDATGDFWAATPLHIALRGQSYAMIELLLARGASIYSRDVDGLSCANLIVSRHSGRLARHIVLQAAEGMQSNIGGSSAVAHLAQRSSIQTLIEHTRGTPEFLDFGMYGSAAIYTIWRSALPTAQTYVLNLGIDLAHMNKTFGSALHYFWLNVDFSLLRRLFKRLGSEKSRMLLNLKPEYRNTPLYNAAATNQEKVIELMLKYGADVDLEGGEEGSPLMVAAACGRLRAVELLLHAGASTCYFDSKVESTISVFKKAEHFPEIQRWLLVGRWSGMRMLEWR